MHTKAESRFLKQRVIEHNFIETVSTNNISVQRGDGARGDRGVKKTKRNGFMKIIRSRGGQHRAEETHSRGIRSTVAGYFLHLFCTKNK